MSIHRNSSSLHIDKLHQQQIFKQAQQTYQKASSLHITRQISRQLSRLIEEKNEMSRCIEDVMQKSYRKIKVDNSSFSNKKYKPNPPHRSTKSFAPELYSNNPSLKKLQTKVGKLKNRILPQDNEQGKVQMKLHEIMMINNARQQQKQSKFKCSQLVKVGRKNGRALIKFGENEVVNSYWDQLSREEKISKAALLKIKENRVNMLIRQNADSKQDLENIFQIKERLNTKLLQRKQRETTRKSTDAYTTKNKKILAKFNIRNTNSHSLNNSVDQEQQAEMVTPKPKKVHHQITKELVQNNFIDYLKNKKERKVFLSQLNKQLIEKDDVFKIYTFVKGGYNLDPYDIEGDYISLKRFNQTKDSFSTLNELYKSIKSQQLHGKVVELEEEMRHSYDRTFRSIVYLNELNGKIAPNQLVKLMRQKKIVS